MDISERIEFWDQPEPTTDNDIIDDLVSSLEKKISSKSWEGIIAHSFGCDLLREVLFKKKFLGKVILISPLKDIPMAFTSLAKKSGFFQQSLALGQYVEERTQKKELNVSENELKEFWNTVQVVSSKKDYFHIFWGQLKFLNKFLDIASAIPALNLRVWQNGLNSYLPRNRSDFSVFSESKIEVLVVLGAKDPYYDNIKMEVVYWKDLGCKAIVCAEAGHYPHLETTILHDILISNLDPCI